MGKEKDSVSYSFACVKGTMIKSNFRKRGFILAYGSRGIESIIVEKAWHGGRRRSQPITFLPNIGSRKNIKWL